MDSKDKDQILDASLSREQITPVAREPLPDASSEGWGSFDRFPIEDREDRPVLDDTRVKENSRAPGGVETYYPVLEDTQGWPTNEARDFRRDEYDPGSVRPATQPPPSETEGEDAPKIIVAGRDE